MTSTKFNLTRDVNGYNGFGLPFSINGYSTELAANVAQSVTVPVTYSNWIAIFSYTPGSNIWVNGVTTAAVPGSSFAATTSQLNPSARAVKGGSTISFITSDSTSPQVGVSFYVTDPTTGT